MSFKRQREPAAAAANTKPRYEKVVISTILEWTPEVQQSLKSVLEANSKQLASDCRVWVGSLGPTQATAVIELQGVEKPVHHWTYLLFEKITEVPEGMEVKHVCAEKKCWNPRHLELVEAADAELEETSQGSLDYLFDGTSNTQIKIQSHKQSSGLSVRSTGCNTS